VPEGSNAMASTDDLRRARSALAEAELAGRPSDRYLAAHLTALRVCGNRADPSGDPGTGAAEWTAAQCLADACRGSPGARRVGCVLRRH
jgi:hypothetical protein